MQQMKRQLFFRQPRKRDANLQWCDQICYEMVRGLLCTSLEREPNNTVLDFKRGHKTFPPLLKLPFEKLRHFCSRQSERHNICDSVTTLLHTHTSHLPRSTARLGSFLEKVFVTSTDKHPNVFLSAAATWLRAFSAHSVISSSVAPASSFRGVWVLFKYRTIVYRDITSMISR